MSQEEEDDDSWAGAAQPTQHDYSNDAPYSDDYLLAEACQAIEYEGIVSDRNCSENITYNLESESEVAATNGNAGVARMPKRLPSPPRATRYPFHSRDMLHTTSTGPSTYSVDDGGGKMPAVPTQSVKSSKGSNTETLGTYSSSRRIDHWYDITREDGGDTYFQVLLGEYGDTKRLACMEGVGVIPFPLSADADRLSELANEPHYKETPLGKPRVASTDFASRAKQLSISFRGAVTKLPFAVRFQLERAIMEGSFIPLTIKNSPARGREAEWKEKVVKLKHWARRMILVFIEEVLPPLLNVDWKTECGGADEESYFTFQELFASNIWKPLKQVKRQIKESKNVNSFHGKVQEALFQARKSLEAAERFCDATESQLSGHVQWESKENRMENFELIVKRSKWPVAEYRCKFSTEGCLIPTDYEVVNMNLYGRKKVPPNSRRAIREAGWPARDRFVLVSSVKLHETFQNNLVKWLKNKPSLCGRKYEYLFDKGSGKPNIWLYSPSKRLSRTDLLASLGCFDGVEPAKLGDRISLAFSQTKPVVDLSMDDIEPIEEIVNNGFKFSDGCGVMGRNIALMIKDAFGLSELPGAVQIRLGGVKGMLSLKTKDFPQDKIGIRPSMIKFRSNHRILEVKKIAKANNSHDNKLFSQILLIIHHSLGVSFTVINELQEIALAKMASKYDPEAKRIVESKDMERVKDYIEKVLSGTKENGDDFRPDEIVKLKKSMMEAQKKLNLQCDIKLMLGVIDEWGILGKDQVLVGNGMVQGPVLICRSPCSTPGDIQKAYAMPGSQKLEPYKYLKDVVVFSAKGDRPLADMLAGGDVDGDEFFIVHESRLVGTLVPAKAYDFGSQKNQTERLVSTRDYFSVTPSLCLSAAPDLREQLEVFQKFLNLGDIVSLSSDAWIREVNEKKNPGDVGALRMADLSQKALDARKLALQPEQVEEPLREMRAILSKHESLPEWKGGNRKSSSILGIIHRRWKQWIKRLETRQNPDDVSLASETSLAEDSTAELTVSDIQISNGNAPPAPAPTEIAMNRLIDIVFQRRRPVLDKTMRINFNCLSSEDLQALAVMVEVEFSESLKQCMDVDGLFYRRTPTDVPHASDVFLLGTNIYTEKLVVCLPAPRGGDLVLLDEDNYRMSLKESDRGYRIASLSGPCRILASLMTKQVPGSLMYHAMHRESKMLMDLVDESETTVINPTVSESLNKSQQRVVATVASPKFKSGFLAVQGPPGTGKTLTIVASICQITIHAADAYATQPRIIVTAPSNAAVAKLACELLRHFSVEDLIVWGEKRRILGDFASKRGLDSAHTSFHDLAELCKCSSADSVSVKRAKVVLCTVNTAGSNVLRRAAQNQFSLLLVDEASQVSEAELFILCTFPGVKRFVVFGDPQQLPATVLHEGCKEAGYGESFLAHLMKLWPEKVHLLSVQYRMDAQILRFSNEYFYSSRIISSNTISKRTPIVRHPIQFVDTGRFGKEEKVRNSWRNEFEADLIKNILHKDEDICELLRSEHEEEDKKIRILVITPYRAQVTMLRNKLKGIRFLHLFDIASVDSFQGQEGDIVILSTVRTHSAGFTDDPHRINVGLTRAKRILRIVGKLQFFKSLPEASILHKLARFAEEQETFIGTDTFMNSLAYRPPDWTTTTKWKPTTTSKFYDCVNKMETEDRYRAMNTLLAIVTPNLQKLIKRPTGNDEPRWQWSSLKEPSAAKEKIWIVWVAKEYRSSDPANAHFVGAVEAHFAGTLEECNAFRQGKLLVPRLARNPTSDMTKVANCSNSKATRSTNIELSWLVTNEIQCTFGDSDVTELPEALFRLDEYQEKILCMTPPLLLESRSGTGKTNVLLQHLISYYKGCEYLSSTIKPACFVTVSSRLSDVLRQRYNEVKKINGIVLPPVFFFCLHDLLDFLLRSTTIEMNMSSVCNFSQYVSSRKSHKKLDVDECQTEDEIGGVIMGSLLAATKKRPLTLQEYLEEKRSNISNKDESGVEARIAIYKVYEKYQKWKTQTGKYDVSDVVLRLLKTGLADKNEVLQSAYLDEVQDFSYATIFLICSIAGKTNLHWVAAGDTAQMISPGCSFTFDGLKQTQLEIRPDAKLGKVERLKQNYRMTKGVLNVANGILDCLKKKFPNAIDSAAPEIAMKDLGLRAVLLDWEKAMKETSLEETSLKLGTQQALIYSSSYSNIERLSKWLNNHPFILSSLESKGLEFDDVIVAFVAKNSVWSMKEASADLQRLLKELYVAVTRARRRVVILVEKKQMKTDSAMVRFFENLDSEIEKVEPKVISVEFKKEVAPDEWFERGSTLLNDENYKLAASCFNAAKQFGWSERAHGLDHVKSGKEGDAKSSFRNSARIFFEASEYEHCLDSLKELVRILPWDSEDNEILDLALKERPDYLPRRATVQFALRRGAWTTISVSDLKDDSIADVFLDCRGSPELKRIVDACSEADIDAIGTTLPNVVGDYYLKQSSLPNAIRYFLLGKDEKSAVNTTERAISNAKADCSKSGHDDVAEKWWRQLGEVVKWWRQEKTIKTSGKVDLLILLFEETSQAAVSKRNECRRSFDPKIIKLVVENTVRAKDQQAEVFQSFDRLEFKTEVLNALQSHYGTQLFDIVDWYLNHLDTDNAKEFAGNKLKEFSDDDLLRVIKKKLRPSGLEDDISRRNLFVEAAKVCLTSKDCWDLDFAALISNKGLESVELSEGNMDGLLKVWRNQRISNDRRVRKWLETETKSSNIALFWFMFENPKACGKQYGKRCIATFGRNVVKEAVNKGGPYAEGANTVLCLFDAKLAAREFNKGDRVVIVGLESENGKHLNGRYGEIKTLQNKNGRYGVEVDGKVLAIKPEKIEIPAPGAVDLESDSSSVPELLKRDGNSDSEFSDKNSSNSMPSLRSHGNGIESDSSSSDVPDLVSNESSGTELHGDGDDSDVSSVSMPGLVRNGDVSSDDEDEPPALLRRQRPNFNDSSGSSDASSGSSDSSEEMPDLEPRQEHDSEDSSSSSDDSSLPPPNARNRRRRGGRGGRRRRGPR